MPKSTTFINSFVHTKKTPFMQRIADYVRNGYDQYVLGQVDLKRAGYLAGKLSENLPLNLDKVATCRRRQEGYATARLLFLQSAEPDILHWILLMHPGKAPDTSGQVWRDALVERISLTGYELVRQTRPEARLPAWTWRYTRAGYDGLRNSIILAIRHKNDGELRRLMESISKSPGFAAVREQVKKLQGAAVIEWQRTRKASESMPEIPKHGYVRRIEDVGVRLSELLPSFGRAGRRKLRPAALQRHFSQTK